MQDKGLNKPFDMEFSCLDDATHVLEFILTSAYQVMLIAGHLLEIANCMTDDVINQLDKIPETIKRAVDSIQEDAE